MLNLIVLCFTFLLFHWLGNFPATIELLDDDSFLAPDLCLDRLNIISKGGVTKEDDPLENVKKSIEDLRAFLAEVQSVEGLEGSHSQRDYIQLSSPYQTQHQGGRFHRRLGLGQNRQFPN